MADAGKGWRDALQEQQQDTSVLIKEVNFKVVLERVLGKYKKPQVRYRTHAVWVRAAEGANRLFVAEAWVRAPRGSCASLLTHCNRNSVTDRIDL